MADQCYLAIDLGAESGRALVGIYDGTTLKLEEVHRFPNNGVNVQGRFYWDVLGLFKEIKDGITKAYQQFGDQLVSMGVDTWGVDYGLLDSHGNLVGNPYCYRDPRTDGMIERAYELMPKEELYGNSGIQIMFFNTVFQLLGEVEMKDPRLANAEKLLFMPDLLNYWLSGKAACEYTIASTSQLMDMRTRTWSKPILDKLNLPAHLLGDVIEPGTELGNLLPQVAEETLVSDQIKVIAVGGHDTASAVAAVPAETENYAYMSSGTWSLMGIEAQEPVINETGEAMAVTNEGGVCNTIRLLKNITGLWLLQECKRQWSIEGEEFDYDQITAMAAEAKPFTAVIDPDHVSFSTPGDMPEKILQYCRDTGQAVPETKGEILRTSMESLALKYRFVMEQLDELKGSRIEVLHIVGGGTQNKLLNQMTADAVNRTVITGPVEATSTGNILMQMVATGRLSSLDEGRALVRTSFETETYTPADPASWDGPFAVLKKNLGG